MKPAAPPAHLFQSKPKSSGMLNMTICAKPCVNMTVRKAQSEPAAPVHMSATGNQLSNAGRRMAGKATMSKPTSTGTTRPNAMSFSLNFSVSVNVYSSLIVLYVWARL